MWVTYSQREDLQNPRRTRARTEVKCAQQISRKHEKYIFEKSKKSR
jgi:hypothetical protein